MAYFIQKARFLASSRNPSSRLQTAFTLIVLFVCDRKSLNFQYKLIFPVLFTYRYDFAVLETACDPIINACVRLLSLKTFGLLLRELIFCLTSTYKYNFSFSLSFIDKPTGRYAITFAHLICCIY